MQTNGRDIVAADAVVEAVAKGTQIVEVAGRHHHLYTGSIKPLTYLLSQRHHLLTKPGDIRGGRPVEGRCPPRILLLLQFLKKTFPRCHVISLYCGEDGYRPFAGYED